MVVSQMNTVYDVYLPANIILTLLCYSCNVVMFYYVSVKHFAPFLSKTEMTSLLYYLPNNIERYTYYYIFIEVFAYKVYLQK